LAREAMASVADGLVSLARLESLTLMICASGLPPP
jgi:hypothetical protein